MYWILVVVEYIDVALDGHHPDSNEAWGVCREERLGLLELLEYY